VSLGVIGVLLAITLPALVGTRSSAQQIASVANLKGIGLTLEHYAQAHALEYPFPARSETRESGSSGFGPVIWHPSGAAGDDATLFYFDSVWAHMPSLWPGVVQSVAPWEERFATWLSPGRVSDPGEPLWRQGGPTFPSYRLSTSVLGAPRIWSGSGAPTDADVHPMRTSDVSSPSGKVIVFDAERAYLRVSDGVRPRPLLFADGAASARFDADATPPVPNPLSGLPPRRYHDTPNGVEGRDF
jgi:type II secretory pathway pseudopilin PulG